MHTAAHSADYFLLAPVTRSWRQAAPVAAVAPASTTTGPLRRSFGRIVARVARAAAAAPGLTVALIGGGIWVGRQLGRRRLVPIPIVPCFRGDVRGLPIFHAARALTAR